MNLERVKPILKKVNALIENLDDQGQTSAIERDLLLRYLRDLYENVSQPNVKDDEISIESHIVASPIAESERPFTEAVVPEKEQSQTTFYDATSTSDAAVVAPSEELPPDPQPIEAVINKFENPVQYFPPAEETTQSEVPAVPVEIKTPVAQTTPAVAIVSPDEQSASVPVSSDNKSERFGSVFIEKSATDLADKYQLQPVVTIEGAMGINERMVTINELFGGEHQVFMETVTHINNLTDYKSAQKYLIEGVADRFSWDSDERLGMASEFVQLVRRKFA